MRVSENVTGFWQCNIRLHTDRVRTTVDGIYFVGTSQAVCNSVQ